MIEKLRIRLWSILSGDGSRALRGNPDFRSLWAAQTVSQLGSQVSNLALPLVAIVALRATTFEVAAVGVAELAPLVLFALPAGVWVDRTRRRPLMIAADCGRALALGSLPLAYLAGVLTLGQLYAVGFATGTLTVFFDVSYQSYLPSLVARGQIGGANARLETSRSGARVAGPGLAGALVSALGAPYAIVADSLSFVASAFFLVRIRGAERVAEHERPRMREDIVEGLRFVLRHPILRPNMAFTASANVFNSILWSVLLLYAVRRLGFSAAAVGAIFSVANVGSLAGALLAPRLQRRVGVGRTMLIAAFSGWWLLLIPLAVGSLRIPFLVVPLLVFGFGVVVYNVASVTLTLAITPARLLGRTTASRRLVVWGTMPLATLLGGALGTWIGLRTTIAIGAGGRALAGLIILRSPVRSVRLLEDADAIVASPEAEPPLGAPEAVA